MLVGWGRNPSVRVEVLCHLVRGVRLRPCINKPLTPHPPPREKKGGGWMRVSQDCPGALHVTLGDEIWPYGKRLDPEAFVAQVTLI